MTDDTKRLAEIETEVSRGDLPQTAVQAHARWLLARVKEQADTIAALAEESRQKCTCGSGAHPRTCKRHPSQRDIDIAEMNVDTYRELCEEAERERDALKISLDNPAAEGAK